MKLIRTESYKQDVNGISARCNIYTIRLFTKTIKVSSNYIYGNSAMPNYKECIKNV